MLSELRELVWRYTAIHFEGGRKIPFPERVQHPRMGGEEDGEPAATWETVEFEDLVTPEVLALITG